MFANAFDFYLYIQAGSSNASANLLAELATHRDPRIRMRVAENPTIPAELLKVLSNDENPDVRIAVALNPNSAFELKRKLAGDKDPTVRLGLAEDIACPEFILKKLAENEDEDPYVKYQAEKTLRVLASWNNLCHMDEFSRHASKRKARSGRKRQMQA